MIRSCRIVQPIRYPRQRPIFQRRYHNLNDERVVVALSGGVDSSVALGLLLAKQRDSISAIYMSNWNLYDDDTVQCTTEVDWKDAQAVARHFQCPIQRVALEAEYWTCVFEPFLDGLSAQQMGNPDIACNTHIKFGALLEIVKKRYGQDTVLATGHYARLWNPSREAAPPFLQSVLDNDSTGLLHWVKESSLESNASILLAAADSSKDQSYFLSGCSGQALRDACFPLGDLYKKSNHSQGAPTVRQLAMEWKVPVANKKDSTGICFVGRRRSFRQFLLQNHYLPRAHAPVDFIDVDTQNVVGTTAPKNAHPVLFTPGQGAKISGRPTKYFVVGILEPTKDFHHNHHHRVGVCAGTHHPALYADTLFLHNVHWITGCPPPRGFNGPSLRLKCRIRHLQPLQDCTLAYDDAVDWCV
ncbi:tRNA-uridine 2-sulfurtransferase [Fistulifera solaris]|uniref:tRNA-5-taurinomethyluridine 2-sulfurtransferase n=1 Tax=Fistulifera solaris TaxID=1519565 RepID=A0A1Z5J7P0_FISSO|nr:tRNA-uridine 2-sulfurtransferase [Fistulifera solaris]|eukprot:GAX10013.1 tRNA-uridine 2-sulfurtransferase [Fistulifera solaris]